MKKLIAVGAIACILTSSLCRADELTAAKAEELLKPMMATDCGVYYTEQGDPDFAGLDGKQICTYKPAVNRIANNGDTATAEYTHDRQFDNDLSVAWLNDYAKMESHKSPSLLFKKLKSNLENWRAHGSVDKGYRPAMATFKFEGGSWKVVAAP